MFDCNTATTIIVYQAGCGQSNIIIHNSKCNSIATFEIAPETFLKYLVTL